MNRCEWDTSHTFNQSSRKKKERLVKGCMLKNNGCQFSRTGENHESTNLEAWCILTGKLKKNPRCIIANQRGNQEKTLQSEHTTYNETNRATTEFLQAAREARGPWSNIFKVKKNNNFWLKIWIQSIF